jgi:hypothetical protein
VLPDEWTSIAPKAFLLFDASRRGLARKTHAVQR